MPTFANDFMQAMSMGIDHEHVSTVSAIILDFDGVMRTFANDLK